MERNYLSPFFQFSSPISYPSQTPIRAYFPNFILLYSRILSISHHLFFYSSGAVYNADVNYYPTIYISFFMSHFPFLLKALQGVKRKVGLVSIFMSACKYNALRETDDLKLSVEIHFPSLSLFSTKYFKFISFLRAHPSTQPHLKITHHRHRFSKASFRLLVKRYTPKSFRIIKISKNIVY